MKAFVKLVVEFVGWRWAPAVALLTASVLYVLLVVGLVPSEIGVPVANAKFGAHLTDGQLGSSETNANTYATSTAETTPVSAPARQMLRPRSPEFGRRGFSPPLERAEPPPSPAPPPSPPAPVPVVTNTLPQRGPLGGIFSRLQGALRPGSVAAQALTHASQSPAPAAAQPAAPPAEAPAVTAPPANASAPSPPAPPEGAAPDAPPVQAAPPGAPSVQPVQPPPPPGAAPSAEPAPEPAPAQ